MSGAATAALPLEGLPKIPCGATDGVTEPFSDGSRAVRVCTLPDGHLERDVAHRWTWSHQPTPIVDESIERF